MARWVRLPALTRASDRANSIRIPSAVGASCYEFAPNLKALRFNDMGARQAMRLLSDRQEIVNAALGGYGTPAKDLIRHGFEYFASDFTHTRDVEQARYLLTTAGHKHLDGDAGLERGGVRSEQSGNGLCAECRRGRAYSPRHDRRANRSLSLKGR